MAEKIELQSHDMPPIGDGNNWMARSRSKKTVEQDVTPASPQKITGEIAVSLTADDNTSVFYINYAEISCAAHEFSIYGTRLPTKAPVSHIEEAREFGKLDISADVQIVFSSTLMPALLRAMSTQKEHYENTFGPIVEPQLQGAEK